jgi:hypothetical protein
MKRLFGYAIILGSLAVPAFAAKNSQNLTIPAPVTVGSTKLPAGEYKVSWTGTGSTVQVTIAGRGRATVTVPAKAVEAKNRIAGVQYETASGANVLHSIMFDNITLQISDAKTGSSE